MEEMFYFHAFNLLHLGFKYLSINYLNTLRPVELSPQIIEYPFQLQLTILTKNKKNRLWWYFWEWNLDLASLIPHVWPTWNAIWANIADSGSSHAELILSVKWEPGWNSRIGHVTQIYYATDYIRIPSPGSVLDMVVQISFGLGLKLSCMQFWPGLG